MGSVTTEKRRSTNDPRVEDAIHDPYFWIKGHAAAESPDPPTTLDTTIAVRYRLARLISDSYSASCTRGSRPVLHPLLNLQLRVIWTTDLAQRVAKLEKLLAKTDEGLERIPRAPELDFGDLPVPG